ncbi:MAG: hypothetical protein ACMUJM_16165 [bacterium]
MKKPTLLIGDYSGIDDLKQAILYTPYTSIDESIPTCRFRGTYIEAFDPGIDTMKVTVWQRNIAKIRKMDVSLPTIVSLSISGDGILTDIFLDESFKGSKGLTCCRKYLNKNLRQKLIGRIFNKDIIKHLKINNLYCYHLVEVLLGAYSYIQIVSEHDWSVRSITEDHLEEEVMDVFVEGGDIHYSGKYISDEKCDLLFTLVFHDIICRIGFNRKGNLSKIDNTRCDFYLWDKLIFSQDVTIESDGFIYGSLQKVLFRCIETIRPFVYNKKRIRLLNTNLFPLAFIGLLVQGIAMRLFRNNYHYIMHILTGLQRHNDIPLCIGAVKTEKEAGRYFPDFSLDTLI